MSAADTISDVGDLVGADEIAEMLGLSRQRVTQLASEAGFPKPLEWLKMGRVWRTTDIQEWARETGRPIIDTGDTDPDQ